MSGRRTIVAIGGGGFSMEPDNPLLDDHILSLTGKARPKVCFLPTASGDSERYLFNFYAAFARRAEASHLALFVRTVDDLDGLLLDQHVIYVGGGNTANMLAIWRIHGVDRAMRAAWEAGVVMAGMSAGAICWFEACTTDSFGPQLRPLGGGLAFLAGSFCPHYDAEAQRRPLFNRLVADGTLPAGYGVDDGAALVFEGTTLVEAVASRPEAAAYHVDAVDGAARETRLRVRQLGG
jgi:dipeptidase E